MIKISPNNQKLLFNELKEAVNFLFKEDIKYLFYAYLLFNLGFEVFLQSQSLYLKTVYLYSTSEIGFFFVVMGLSFAISMFLIHPKLDKLFEVRNQIKIGIVIMGLSLLFYGLSNITFNYSRSTQIQFTWINSIFFYLATPFVTLNMMKIFSDIVSNDSQGSLMGALGQISSIATVFGAIFMGFLSAIEPDLNACFGGLFILIGALILRNLLKQETAYDI